MPWRIDLCAAGSECVLRPAGAVFAALAIGVFGGMGLALLDRLQAPAVRADALTALGTLLAGVVLLAAAEPVAAADRSLLYGRDSRFGLAKRARTAASGEKGFRYPTREQRAGVTLCLFLGTPHTGAPHACRR